MMKKYSKYLLIAMCVVAVAFSAGAFMKASAAKAPGQPVDLTYAAEKALPAVVHIKYVQNSKTKTVEVEDPFGDFFDPFGFFGNPGNGGGTRKQKVQTPKREGSGSGVIISADGYIVTNNHVVNGADELTVTLNDNTEFSARIIDPVSGKRFFRPSDGSDTDILRLMECFDQRMYVILKRQIKKLYADHKNGLYFLSSPMVVDSPCPG